VSQSPAVSEGRESGVEAAGHKADGDSTLAVDAALAQLEETVGDRAFVAELLGDFLAELPAQLAELRAALAAGDAERLSRGAHTLKSNAATFGADGLAGACRELEHAAAADSAQLVARVEAEAASCTPGLAAARDERSS
jgi:HPt (histidine-containing phosphotransfer) domain-containing protein